MTARRRAVPALIALLVLAAIGLSVEPRFWTAWWFYIGVGTALSVTFVEPFFTRPQDALINSLGAVAAYFTASRSGLGALYLAYLSIAVLVFASSAAAALFREPPSRLKLACHRFAARFGRALVLGPAALILEVVRRAYARNATTEPLGFAVIALIALLGPDWNKVLEALRTARQGTSAIAVSAIGPGMLLVSSENTDLRPGDQVTVSGGAGSSAGTVTARVAHLQGLRYHVALGQEWASVCSRFPAEVRLEANRDAPSPVGVVGAGSTHSTVEFEPLEAVGIGTAVSVSKGEGLMLYQVTALKLRQEAWGGGQALISHAVATQIGIPVVGFLRTDPYLAEPHAPVALASEVTAALPEGYCRIGVALGTNIPIGIEAAPERRTHIAILGMSGMGKTAAAHRVASVFAENCVVVALDTTGEYRSRLSVPLYSDDLMSLGFTVKEPGGDPSQRAAEFIGQCMTLGNQEYLGATRNCTPRVLLLEEAHSFVPEWNFATRNQQDYVTNSTRMIMQARKFALSFVIVSQRTAVVSKSALSQCESYIVLKTIDETSLSYMEAVVGAEVRKAISTLRRYEAVCVGPAFNADGPVIVALDPPP